MHDQTLNCVKLGDKKFTKALYDGPVRRPITDFKRLRLFNKATAVLNSIYPVVHFLPLSPLEFKVKPL